MSLLLKKKDSKESIKRIIEIKKDMLRVQEDNLPSLDKRTKIYKNASLDIEMTKEEIKKYEDKLEALENE